METTMETNWKLSAEDLKYLKILYKYAEEKYKLGKLTVELFTDLLNNWINTNYIPPNNNYYYEIVEFNANSLKLVIYNYSGFPVSDIDAFYYEYIDFINITP